MEITLIIIAFLFLLVGLVGAVVPALPGPPLSYVGLLLLQWSGRGGFSLAFLLVWAGIVIAVTVMDNILPAWITKKFGGSRIAIIGSVLGLIVGMVFFAPVGLLVGPFLGALAGELLNNRIKAKRGEANGSTAAGNVIAPNETQDTVIAPANGTSTSTDNAKALKVALGSFLAFIVGTGAKLMIGSLMIFYAVKAVF